MTFGHKTGLSNHRRVCVKWKNVDGVAKHREKRRRLEMQTLGPNSNHNLPVPSKAPGLSQQNGLSLEVRISLLLCIILDYYKLAYN